VITVVGMGPGGREYLTPVAATAIEQADLVMCAKRWRGAVGDGKECLDLDLKKLVELLRADSGENIAVLVSGDPGVYSVLGVIKREAPGAPVEVIPGISSFQVLFARMALEWDDVRLVSLHGRPMDRLWRSIDRGSRVCVFTDGKNNPGRIGRELTERGFSGRAVVGEALTCAEESIVSMRISELCGCETGFPAVVYLEID
jgi:cobalt-precorrin-7 (C5)-methyltransferase